MNNVLPIEINIIFKINSPSADRREETILDNFWFQKQSTVQLALATWQLEKKEWESFKWQQRKKPKEKNEEMRQELRESLELRDCAWKDLKLDSWLSYPHLSRMLVLSFSF